MPAVAFRGIWPSLAVPVLVCIAVRVSALDGALVGLVLGASMDLFASTPFGVLSLLYGGLGASTAVIADNFSLDHVVGLLALVAAAMLALGTASIVVSTASGGEFSWRFFTHLAGRTAYTVLLAAIVVVPLRRIRRWLGLAQRARFSHV